MDLLKLFYDHDLRLDKLAKRNANKNSAEDEATLADFMQPTLTYSKFYVTGTLLNEKKFGLSTLAAADQVLNKLDSAFAPRFFHTSQGTYDTFPEAVDAVEIGDVVIISESSPSSASFEELAIDEESNVGHRTDPLRCQLKTGDFVLYKEPAHHGHDLHLFSLSNIYEKLFYAFQPLISENFRFFSINSKRMRSERHFYFETWTLDRPPHGAEEVYPGTKL